MARMTTPLGKRIREARRERGLSQAKLAELAGISLSTVQRIEREDRETTPANLVAVLRALKEVAPLNEAMERELHIATFKPAYYALFPNREKEEKEEESRWKAELPILHKRIDLFRTYQSFRVTYDLVDRLRSLEEAVYGEPVSFSPDEATIIEPEEHDSD